MNNIDVDFNKVAEQTFEWNLLAGNNIKNPEWEDIVAQSKVFFEEAKELHEAILLIGSQPPESDTEDQLCEVADGIADTLFAYPVLIDMLTNFGFDGGKAFDIALTANKFKMFSKNSEAILHMSKLNKADKVDLRVEENTVNGETVFTIRDKNNKIIKRVDHPDEDFTDCLPQC